LVDERVAVGIGGDELLLDVRQRGVDGQRHAARERPVVALLAATDVARAAARVAVALLAVARVEALVAAERERGAERRARRLLRLEEPGAHAAGGVARAGDLDLALDAGTAAHRRAELRAALLRRKLERRAARAEADTPAVDGDRLDARRARADHERCAVDEEAPPGAVGERGLLPGVRRAGASAQHRDSERYLPRP